MDPLIIALIVGAVSVLAVMEILVAYQKYLMRKQFLEGLDQGSQRN